VAGACHPLIGVQRLYSLHSGAVSLRERGCGVGERQDAAMMVCSCHIAGRRMAQ